MEVMQQLRAEVGKTKEVIHHFKEDLEEVVEEALLKRRSSSSTTSAAAASRTTSDGSTLTTVSSISSETRSSSSGDVSVDEAVNEEAAGDSHDKKQENSVYLDKIEGSEIEWSEFNVKEDDLAAKLKGTVDIQQVMSAVINGTVQVQTPEEDKTSAEPSKKEATYELEESDEEVVELEFERAAEKMHTHDGYGMYCPNCSNRITKVVLRRKIRRRTVPPVSPAVSERCDLFGCLSCFSIFSSSGNYRLNPFRIFGAGIGREESIQLPQEQQPTPDVTTMPTSGPAQAAAAGKGFDLFWLFRKGRELENAETSPLQFAGEEKQPSSATITQKPRDEAIEQGRRFNLFWPFRKGTRDHENDLTSPLLEAASIQSSSTTVTYKPRDGGIEQGLGPTQPGKDENSDNLLGSSSGDSTEALVHQTVTTTTTVAVGKGPLGKFESDGVATTVLQSTPPPQGSALNVDNVIIDVDKQENIIGGMKQPMKQPELLEVTTQINTYYQPQDAGDDHVRIPVGSETPHETGIISSTTPAPGPPIVTEAPSSRSVEIVKSMVYGGLMESVASLSVVSSAAASDATTLNIVVLGLANLVGGLVVLAHNLKDLRYGDSGQTINEEKYKRELGRKEHFPLHAAVAVLSYVISGLIPPVVYGSTFRETNDRDSKMLAVAAAALLGIFFLAIAKAYVRGEHSFMAYFKTVTYYITAAVAASGIAFAVGDLTQKLLEELGWLEPAAPAAFGASQFQLFPREPKYSY